MQLSTAISVLSMALVAAASPEVYARGGKNTACCNGIANCLVFVGSNSCSGYSMKCKTNQKEGSFGSIVDLGINLATCNIL
ncbi:hypothetical protein IWW34DRAFT_757205 [Fusarium oxysporum f. sp. albedinis]|nr:hypothetical protein IWW34DRAFT_757205 [Fusarium oxysporum f. sp. albedinis]